MTALKNNTALKGVAIAVAVLVALYALLIVSNQSFGRPPDAKITVTTK